MSWTVARSCVRDGVDRLPAVDGPQDAVVAIVLDDLEQGRDLFDHPRPDRRLVVVGALDEI